MSFAVESCIKSLKRRSHLFDHDNESNIKTKDKIKYGETTKKKSIKKDISSTKKNVNKQNINKFPRKKASNPKDDRAEVPAEIIKKYDNYGPALESQPLLYGRNQQYKKHKMLVVEKIRTEGLLETARQEKLMTGLVELSAQF